MFKKLKIWKKVESPWKICASLNGFLSDMWLVEDDRTSPCWPISNKADAMWFAAHQNSFSPLGTHFHEGSLQIGLVQGILMIIIINYYSCIIWCRTVNEGNNPYMYHLLQFGMFDGSLMLHVGVNWTIFDQYNSPEM